jgi:predicted RNase H-like HicB family nuclease
MKSIIQYRIFKGDKYYVAEGIDLPVVTQGATLDELAKNIQEATELCLEGEDLADFGLAPSPSVLLNFELPRLPLHAQT